MPFYQFTVPAGSAQATRLGGNFGLTRESFGGWLVVRRMVVAGRAGR
jgi:hypothetical protein